MPDEPTTSVNDLLTAMIARKASDLHLVSGSIPHVRVRGRLEPLDQFKVLTGSETERLSFSILNDTQRATFEAENELDLSFGIGGVARFRVNLYRQRGTVAAAFRIIPFEVPVFADLGLPPVVEQLAARPKGLVLVTGPTGSGKSTTIAAMIDKINSERHDHIITIEDPIEFLHPHKKSVVSQREILSDTRSFRDALRTMLRQDPDVVLVGEMRDLETIQAAISVAETGHLTFGTLHTNSCAQTINRIIDAYPMNAQDQVRAQLSLVLEGILSQVLIPTADGQGRVMAMEIMLMTGAIRNQIRENRIHQIYSTMQASAPTGMQTLNQSLNRLVKQQLVTKEEALLRSPFPDELSVLFQQPDRPAPTR